MRSVVVELALTVGSTFLALFSLPWPRPDQTRLRYAFALFIGFILWMVLVAARDSYGIDVARWIERLMFENTACRLVAMPGCPAQAPPNDREDITSGDETPPPSLTQDAITDPAVKSQKAFEASAQTMADAIETRLATQNVCRPSGDGLACGCTVLLEQNRMRCGVKRSGRTSTFTMHYGGPQLALDFSTNVVDFERDALYGIVTSLVPFPYSTLQECSKQPPAAGYMDASEKQYKCERTAGSFSMRYEISRAEYFDPYRP